MIIDAHTHLEPELPAEGLVAAMDEAGVQRAVLIGAAQAPIGRIDLRSAKIFHACMRIPPLRMPMYRTARKRLHQHARPDNDAVFAAAAAHPERFLPFAFVNPLLDDALDELDRRIAEGARGVKLHLWFHRYRLPQAMGVLARCEQHGLPVLAHLGFGPAEDVAIVMDALPKLKLILAHAGIPHFERLWADRRLFFDTAAVPALISPALVRRLMKKAAERVVYGSDAPIGIRAPEDGYRPKGLYRYAPPALPEQAYGARLASLL